MKNILLVVSLVAYVGLTMFSIYMGGLWLIGIPLYIVGIIFDIWSYVRLIQGKGILTINNWKKWM